MAVVATGFFDGVHLGHRAVIRQLVGAAAERGVDSAVVTFSPHPRAVLQKDASHLRLLTSFDEKKALLLSLGVSRVEVIPFTREFASLTAREYIKSWLVERFGCTAMVFGYDNKVGSDGADASAVRSIADDLGVELIPCTALGDISSTKIRAALSRGDVEGASEMLGYDYFLNGVVVSGNRIGRTLGFPTANMQLYEPLKLVPENGVYLVRVELPDVPGGVASSGCEVVDSRDNAGERLPLYGMCNIGSRPTVNIGSNITIETNIFGFCEDIYGLPLKISFLRRLRGETRFSSTAALRDQLALDRDRCLEILGEIPNGN